MPPKVRNLVWATGAILVATRVVLLAHWFSDVLAGFGLGVALERALRWLTKPMAIDGAHRETCGSVPGREA
jgi:membrane-associated phospholipid phosphatase